MIIFLCLAQFSLHWFVQKKIELISDLGNNKIKFILIFIQIQFVMMQELQNNDLSQQSVNFNQLPDAYSEEFVYFNKIHRK